MSLLETGNDQGCHFRLISFIENLRQTCLKIPRKEMAHSNPPYMFIGWVQKELIQLGIGKLPDRNIITILTIID